MPIFVRRLAYFLCLMLLAAGCGGGGCSSCAGGAITPIRGGFPLTPDRRIPHAMQIRLTDQGLRSVEAIAPDLLAGFIMGGISVPETDGPSCLLSRIRICPGGGCRLNVSLATAPLRGLSLSFAAPDQIRAQIRLVIQSAAPRHIEMSGCALNGRIIVDSTQGSRRAIGLETSIAMRRDTHAERSNYFRADLISPTGSGDTIREIPGEEIENSDIRFDGSGIGSLLEPIVNALRGTLIGQFRGQLSAALGPIQDALAHTSMPDPPGCPTGTRVDGQRCRYADNSLVPILLGTDGTGNFGALLGGITPGVRAPASYVIAAGDPAHGAETTATGMTLNAYGAVVSGQHNACVPRVTPPMTPAIPEWMALRQNNIPGTTMPIHLGIGISEEFLNSAMWNLWDAGMFCLGVNTRLSQQIAASFFTALPPLSTLRFVIFPNGRSGGPGAAAALILRPQQPPTVTVGRGTNIMTDPLLRLNFTRLAIDFYGWSEERYVRFMTVTTDLVMPINLMQDAMGLRPTIGMAAATNTSVTNTQLLSTNPTALSMLLESLLGTVIGMFAGNIPPIALPSIPVPGPGGMPVGQVAINLPPNGIVGVTEGSSRFLGLFANLEYRRGAMMQGVALDTTATLERMPFDPNVFAFGPDFRTEQLPRVRLHLASPESFGNAVEFSYRVDDMTWSPWSREADPVVQSPSFVLQGTHHIEVRARIADEPATADPDPARVAFTIDTVAPSVAVERRESELVITGHDDVSSAERLTYNVAFDGQSNDRWSTDTRVAIPPGAARYVVRVRDESDNEGVARGNLPAPTIRGGESTDTSGCGCNTPGRDASNNATGLAAVLGAVASALLLARRSASRRRRAVAVSPARRATPRPRGLGAFLWVIPLFFVALGCDCSGTQNPDGGRDGGGEAGADSGMCPTGMERCASMNRCVPTPTCMCPRGQVANGMPRLDPMTCNYDTSAGAMACNCMPLPPLSEGMAGSHLDMAIHTDNTIWMSSYSAGDPFNNRPYGDLVVGRWNMAMTRVDWQHVDGVPADGEVGGALEGWRGGIVAPGPDVGRFNSLALDPMGRPRVAYWDATADKLKYAAFDGTNWTSHVVDTTGRNGRYASLVMLAGGIPAIAYRQTLPDPMMPTRIISRVRYARANNATPAQASDWTITDVASAPTQCRAADCAMGQACLRSTGVCAPTGTGCPAACGSDQACVMGMCQDVYTSNWIEDYPPGIGLFNSLAVDSMGRPQLVYYDRDRGNLMGARVASGTMFSAPFVIDGENAMRADLGDRGMWATLALGADGTWHVGYVDAYEERVLYTTVRDGVRTGAPEVIDSGEGTGMTPFPDGHHIVGDSLALEVDAMGGVRAVYQDATDGTMRLATRGAMGWTATVLDMMGHTGYWARIERGQVGVFWRNMMMRQSGVRVMPAR